MKDNIRDPYTKITTELTKTTVDSNTGELLAVSSEKVGIVPKEPNYVKLYLEDIAYLSNIPKWGTTILYELLKRMNYRNEIILSSGIKRMIVSEMHESGLNVTVQAIGNALTDFVKAKILIRKDTGVYLANPFLFGKGEWKDIRNIRLQVGYNLDGTRELKADIEKADESFPEKVEKRKGRLKELENVE